MFKVKTQCSKLICNKFNAIFESAYYQEARNEALPIKFFKFYLYLQFVFLKKIGKSLNK